MHFCELGRVRFMFPFDVVTLFPINDCNLTTGKNPPEKRTLLALYNFYVNLPPACLLALRSNFAFRFHFVVTSVMFRILLYFYCV